MSASLAALVLLVLAVCPRRRERRREDFLHVFAFLEAKCMICFVAFLARAEMHRRSVIGVVWFVAEACRFDFLFSIKTRRIRRDTHDGGANKAYLYAFLGKVKNIAGIERFIRD